MLATILVATALVYMPSVGYGWVYDDKAQIVQAKDLHSLAGIGKSFIYDIWWFRDPTDLPQSSYYRPLQATWIALNWMTLGNHPAAWHLEKIVVELIGVMLCFRLAQLITRRTIIALVTAAIFGLLRANVEAVVWVSAIPEPMSAIFEMGALCCLINRKPGPGLSRGMVFALMLYAGALLSHETAVLFWLVIAAYAYLIERKRAGESIRIAAPFILLAILYLCARLNALGIVAFAGRPDTVHPAVAFGWEKPFPPHGLLDIIRTLPVAIMFYLGVLAIPGMGGPAHDVQWVTAMNTNAVISAGALVLLATVAIILIRRSPDWRLYLFCAAWSIVAIAPAMSLKALTELVQDRLLYAPSFGWSLAISIAAIRIAAIGWRARTIVAGAISLWLIANAAAIVRVERYWHDDVTFFSRCIAIDPDNAEYLRGLVEILNEQGDPTSAMNMIRNAVNRDPDNVYLHGKLAAQYGNMNRGADFQAEIFKIRALRAGVRNGNAPASVAPSSR